MTQLKRPRRPLWQRVLITLSFGLNALVICAVVGLLLSGSRSEGDRPPPLRSGVVAPMIGVLPPDARRDVLKQLRRFGKDNGVSHMARSELDSRAIAVITADPFDPQAMVELLDDNQDRFKVYSRESHVLLAEQLSLMSSDERRAYADRLSRVQRVSGKRPKDHDDKKRP